MNVLPIFLLAVVSLVLVATGIIRRPGIGVIFALVVVVYLALSREQGLVQFGFRSQESWVLTLLLSLGVGLFLALFSMAVIEPLAEKITGQPHDISIVEGTKGNLLVLLQWLVAVWLFVGFLEELLFRGYLMTEFMRIAGNSTIAEAVAVAFSSIVFGLAHLYQGASGGISATLVGGILGFIFLVSDSNLWLLILIHGFVDTVQIILISLNKDSDVRRWILPTER